jgi:hypothetical protein
MVTPGSDLKPPSKLRAARGDHVITALHTQYRIWILFLSHPIGFVRGRTIHDAEKLPQISHEKWRRTYILHCGIFIVVFFCAARSIGCAAMIFAHGPMRGSEKIGLQLPSGVRRFVLNPIPQQGRHLPWTLP